jgi:DNA-binding CsgD family transcriptional regulator
MAKQSVTIEGVEYKSRTAAAVAMVAAGKTLTEAAEALGMTYQTVYANTKGATKVGARRAMYRVLALGKSGRRTASEIAKKTNLSVSKVVALLKKNQIAIVSKETRAAAKALKSGKAPRAPKVTEPVAPVIDEPITDEVPEDAAARAAAEVDMASAQ